MNDLLGLGEVATAAKRRFIGQVGEPARGEGVQDADHVPRLQRRHQRISRPSSHLMTATESFALREQAGLKTIRKHELSAAEIEQIIEAYKGGRLTQKETAFAFGVSEGLVSRLVSAQRNDPLFLASLRKREDKRRDKLRAVMTESCA